MSVETWGICPPLLVFSAPVFWRTVPQMLSLWYKWAWVFWDALPHGTEITMNNTYAVLNLLLCLLHNYGVLATFIGTQMKLGQMREVP